ncbi:MAG: carboxypeptidase-like regulatory domain-containing protein [Bacteroidota bacterium]
MKSLNAVLTVVLLTCLLSCQKGDTGPAGNNGTNGTNGLPGPAYVGSINGHISLFDQYGSKVLIGLTGIQVSISSNPIRTVTTDANGYYSFDSVITGLYTLTAHDTNSGIVYGDSKFQDLQLIRDTLSRDIKLSATANFAPLTFTASSVTAALYDTLTFTFAADTRARSIMIFVNGNSTVNSNPANYLLSYSKAINANATSVVFYVPAGDLYNIGFTSGSTAYYAVYGSPVSNNSIYEDFSNGKLIYNSLSTISLSASCIVP